MLPKIYNKINNPGWPVVSSVGCHNTNISKFVDYHLKPIVQNIPSYVQHSNDFRNRINTAKNIPPNWMLVTMDVKSLYTNIANSEGILTVKVAYGSYQEKSVTTKVTITLFAQILTLNNLILNCKNYLQIKGWEMGTAWTISVIYWWDLLSLGRAQKRNWKIYLTKSIKRIPPLNLI